MDNSLMAAYMMLTSSSTTALAQMSTFFDDFNKGHDASIWIKSGGYANGSPFNVGWLSNHVQFTNDTPASHIMTLRLDNVRTSGMRYSSGEYRTKKKVSYGTVSARIKAARGNGLVSSLFVYTGPAYDDPWDEINIEFLGKDTTYMHLNYFTNGIGNHETVVRLGFDASLAYHDYAFTWKSNSIRWYVDGKLVHTETGARGPLPTHPGFLFMNLWTGDSTIAPWLGHFKYNEPIYVFYDNVSYTRLSMISKSP